MNKLAKIFSVIFIFIINILGQLVYETPCILTNSNLKQNSTGKVHKIIFHVSSYLVNPPIDSLFDAVYYLKLGKIVFVKTNGVVQLYCRDDISFKPFSASKKPPYESKVTWAYYTRIPGLLYIDVDNLKIRRELESDRFHARQIYPNRPERVNLSNCFSCEGVPLDTGRIVEGFYYKIGKMEIALTSGTQT